MSLPLLVWVKKKVRGMEKHFFPVLKKKQTPGTTVKDHSESWGTGKGLSLLIFWKKMQRKKAPYCQLLGNFHPIY